MAAMNDRRPEDAPERDNYEQSDDGQNLGIEPGAPDEAVGESERGTRAAPDELIPDDTPDLVERMEGMVRSGLIDNDAFRGEPVHDDEPDILGDTGEDLDDV